MANPVSLQIVSAEKYVINVDDISCYLTTGTEEYLGNRLEKESSEMHHKVVGRAQLIKTMINVCSVSSAPLVSRSFQMFHDTCYINVLCFKARDRVTVNMIPMHTKLIFNI
jgi:hypothetical protein